MSRYEPEEYAVRVCEPPEEATRFVADVEIEADFQSVQRLKEQTQARENEECPPAKADVGSRRARGALGIGRHHVGKSVGLRNRAAAG